MTQKIRRVGNSAGVILPRDVLRQAGLKLGAAVDVEVRAEGDIVIRKAASGRRPTISSSLARRLDRFIERYRPALEKLAE